MASQTTPQKVWTVLELITWSTNHLQEKKFDEARLTVELMLAHALSMKRIQLYLNFDKPLKPEELAAFKVLFKRRLAHEPVQYILGRTDFMGLPFEVDSRVLIPRPETEVLVEQTVRLCKELRSPGESVSLLDIGTGSGCIAVSCAKLIADAHVTALDVSAEAIDAARANAERNGVSISFSLADVFSQNLLCPDAPLQAVREPGTAATQDPAHGSPLKNGMFDAIVSNPPYISRSVYDTLQPEITQFEPRFAETDEGDGLTFYRRLAVIGKKLLVNDGFIAVEHAFDQQEAVMAIFADEGWRSIIPINDYSGNPRCVIARDFSAA
ncbi:MAG TPA: peptide chain release factor N(5)-glutamine methyltransferase [Bacteroidota bacterium]|nr:peptide chain release factor N(5)-glutamine methyltransferase [Bacteroidota bacterium]